MVQRCVFASDLLFLVPAGADGALLVRIVWSLFTSASVHRSDDAKPPEQKARPTMITLPCIMLALDGQTPGEKLSTTGAESSIRMDPASLLE